MKKIIYSSIIALMGVVLFDCSDSFLDRPPQGSLSLESLQSEKGVNSVLISAYSALDGWTDSWGAGSPWPQAGTNWIFGDVAGGDAYKGSDPGDQAQIVPIEKHQGLPTNDYFSAKWKIVYNGVARSNATLNLLATVPTIAPEKALIIQAEARFLRAHFHFEAKKMWNMVPFIDENVPADALKNKNPDAYKVPNNVDIWPLIEADMQFAIDNLPETMSEVGRANKWAATAYMAKMYMFQGKLAQAKPLLQAVIDQGKTSDGKSYALNACYHDNFKAETKNSAEAIFSIQASVNDGNADGQNGNWGDILNNPYTNGPGTCCGFHQPAQNLVNAFRTNASGLPLLDTFNDADAFLTDQGISGPAWNATTKYLKDAQAAIADPLEPNVERVYKSLTGVAGSENIGNSPLTSPASWVEIWRENATVTLDPRLDWTIGRRSIPYLDWGTHGGQSWIRDQAYAGPYSPKKRVYYKAGAKTLSTATGWAQGPNANNYTLIRFADVLLWRAEVAADESDLATAVSLVNQIRNRAKNGCKVQDGTVNAANYVIEPYASFADKATAIKAVRFERRLELALEGHKFFDLVRWGIADQTLDAYYLSEGAKRSYLAGSTFAAGKNEYYPIPQDIIIQSALNDVPTITQNPGY